MELLVETAVSLISSGSERICAGGKANFLAENESQTRLKA